MSVPAPKEYTTLLSSIPSRHTVQAPLPEPTSAFVHSCLATTPWRASLRLRYACLARRSQEA